LVDAAAAYLHPFDDPLIWAGHASLIDEVLTAGLAPDAVVLAVGGGGLLCGVAAGLQNAGLAKVHIVTAETLGAESFYLSVQAGEVVTLERISSVATTLGAKQVASQALAVSRAFEVISHVVTDREAIEACLWFADDHRGSVLELLLDEVAKFIAIHKEANHRVVHQHRLREANRLTSQALESRA
jgi:L-serine/L-threonine ammonia-lyase